MTSRSRPAILAAVSMFCFGVAASAETMRCQSVNGNLNCAGSNGVSCQTVDGKKVCVSGQGDVVQSFGNTASSPDDADDADDADETADAKPLHQHLERHDRRGRTLRLDRDGTKLDLHTNWLSLHQD
jgi:hypothetical protein